MAAKVEYFGSIRNLPHSTYWDTNYIFDLLRYYDHKDSSAKGPRYREAGAFYIKLKRNNVTRFTSIIAVEEAIHIILYTTGIMKDMKKYTDSNGDIFSSHKQFKKEKLLEFEKSHKKHMVRVLQFLAFLGSLGLTLIYPKEFRHLDTPQVSKRVSDYSVALLKKYKLESMDALHVAIARCARIEAIVSNDKDFKDIDEIKLYCFR